MSYDCTRALLQLAVQRQRAALHDFFKKMGYHTHICEKQTISQSCFCTGRTEGNSICTGTSFSFWWLRTVSIVIFLGWRLLN